MWPPSLRIAEHIAAGTESVAALAAACDADAGSLARVLRHQVSRGVFEEPEPGRFTLNDAARQLLDEGLRLGLDLNGSGIAAS